MRILLLISMLLFGHTSYAVDIFGMDFYLRDSFVRVIDDERGTSIVLDADQFFVEPGSTILNPIQYKSLNKVAKVVKAYPHALLSITGHTDDVYSQAKRYQLSEGYARRIADFLVDAGVDPNRIREVSGEGDLWPIAPGNTAQRRHLNRRVEITFLRKALPKVIFKEAEGNEEIDIEIAQENRMWQIEVDEKIATPTGKESISVIVSEPLSKK